MQQALAEYIEAYSTLEQLQKTLDGMNSAGSANLNSTIVEKSDNNAEVFAAFEMQAEEFKRVQQEFSDYMDRLQDDIAMKAEKFGHVEFYDARLQDGYSNEMAIAASEVNELDERRKPLAVSNPLLAKETVMLPEPSVEDVTYEHVSLNLPSIAVNALDAISRIAVSNPTPAKKDKAAPDSDVVKEAHDDNNGLQAVKEDKAKTPDNATWGVEIRSVNNRDALTEFLTEHDFSEDEVAELCSSLPFTIYNGGTREQAENVCNAIINAGADAVVVPDTNN